MFILDTDGGTDDALALLMLLGNDRAPDLITTCFGNVGLEQSTVNILDVLSVAGVDIPVHTGAEKPLRGPIVNAQDVHGEDGLGGATRPQIRSEVSSSDAVGEIIRVLRNALMLGRQGSVDILMLGPLTNLALVLDRAPELAAAIGRLWIMGGTCRGRGNITAAAEFNIYCDPEAAEIVLGQPLNTTVIPWEPTLQTALPADVLAGMFSRLPDCPVVSFAREICDHGRALAQDWYQDDFLIMPDPLAAAYVLDEAVSTRTMICGVLVETEGRFSRGATIIDYEGKASRPVVGIVEKVDRTKLEKYFELGLEGLASRF
ncbi:nucleoside hydrolase [Rhodobacteraceae bacterium RKSG542]|uniref:nucleoside hydrolase n=1 Tax=Pseudovibrio flavus TaxID=2529854 RepID=UPI0035270601|nr:nucleoside hydrolase [Pseudovibrio flavus]